MANEAAALVDRVLPAVPVRQWVLSLPFELRALAALDAKVLTALSRIFADAVGRWYRRWAERAGVGRGDGVRPGAVTFVQRFGSSLNLNVHFHTSFLDGVYVRDASGPLAFHEAPSPTREDLDGVVRDVHRRALRWLERRGHLGRPPLEERSNEAALPSPIEACAAIATQRGTMRTLAEEARGSDLTARSSGAEVEGPRREASASEHGGFNLHASVRIAADDDLGRERLCRYGARPALSLERLRVLPGGRIAYRTKKVGAGRAKHRLMTPLELLARLAALVPPPRYPLVRYHGVLAPHATWRREIVPRPPVEESPHHEASAHVGRRERSCRAPGDDAASPRGASRRRDEREGRRGEAARPNAPSMSSISTVCDTTVESHAPHATLARETTPREDVTRLTPNIIRVRHWSRLLGGLLYASSPRVRWSELLRRTFDVDVLACPACHGRIQIVETVADKSAARRVLERLGITPDAPSAVRARDPTTLDGDEPEAA